MDEVTEQLEILRRIAERGRNLCLTTLELSCLDLFQHLLDEIYRTKKAYIANQTGS